jgi:large-conductance mechanosensitive channel
MPQTDFIKLIASHVTAVLMVVLGISILSYAFLTPSVDKDARAQLAALLGPFIGYAVNFLFQTNTSSATRAQTRKDLLEEPPA